MRPPGLGGSVLYVRRGLLPGGGVVQVEPAGAVEYFFWAAAGDSDGQHRVFVLVAAGQVDREAPIGWRTRRNVAASTARWCRRATRRRRGRTRRGKRVETVFSDGQLVAAWSRSFLDSDDFVESGGTGMAPILPHHGRVRPDRRVAADTGHIRCEVCGVSDARDSNGRWSR